MILFNERFVQPLVVFIRNRDLINILLATELAKFIIGKRGCQNDEKCTSQQAAVGDVLVSLFVENTIVFLVQRYVLK